MITVESWVNSNIRPSVDLKVLLKNVKELKLGFRCKGINVNNYIKCFIFL